MWWRTAGSPLPACAGERPDGIGHVAALLKPFKPDDLASRLFEILHPERPENVVPFSANRKA